MAAPPDVSPPGYGRWLASSRGRLALVLAIVGAAAALRIHNARSLLPVLVDEAIYLRWAEIIDHQGEWFISLLDGKQPLSYWLLFVLRRLGTEDPLLSARLLSAAAGVATTAAILGFGWRMAGWWVGAGAALAYAMLPYAVLYDSIAYTDALANLPAVLIAWTSFEAFEARSHPWLSAAGVGVVLAFGAMVKTTVLQFALFPVGFGWLFARTRPGLLAGRLVVVYALPATALWVTSWFRPVGPRPSQIDALFHRTDFFLSLGDLPTYGWDLLRFNAGLSIGYLDAYVTLPLMLAAVIGIACVAHRRHAALAVVVVAGLLPFAAQVLLLRYYPSRYLFAASWIVLFAAAYALALGGSAGHMMRAALLVPVLLKTTMLLSNPAAALHPRDAAEFLGSGPYSGFGVREASNFLRREAENGEFLLLTDPYWGPPTDALFAYLQGRQGIAVREAWWLQVEDERYPIVPARAMPVMKSQYQRVAAGTLDFPSCCRRIFYVTDTNYRSQSDVLALQSDARLVARFVKANGIDSIDVYRIR